MNSIRFAVIFGFIFAVGFLVVHDVVEIWDKVVEDYDATHDDHAEGHGGLLKLGYSCCDEGRGKCNGAQNKPEDWFYGINPFARAGFCRVA